MIGWAAVALTCLSLWRLGNKRRDGFMFGVCGNLAWIVFAAPEPMWSIIAVNVIIMALNVRGHLKWRGDNGRHRDRGDT